MDSVAIFDRTITTGIYSAIPHIVIFDWLFRFLSVAGFSLIIWFVIVIALLIFEEMKDKRFILYFLISSFTTAFLVNIVFKNIFHRLRPQLLTFSKAAFVCPKDFSFPSGHAAVAFACAVILARFDKKRAKFYYGIAILISLSRIYLGCHYFLDVLSGAIAGTLISLLVLRIKIPRRS